MREEYGEAQAYAIGGEEFALLLPDDGRAGGLHRRRAPARSCSGRPTSRTPSRSRSAPASRSYPSSAGDRDQLLRVADGALYWARTTARIARASTARSVVRIYTPEELAETAERHARLKAAEGLIRVVDAKDTYAGAHSQSVSRLVEGIARAMGLDEETVEQVRLAGLLHDLGKIAIPDRILQKPDKLDPTSCASCASTPSSATGCSRAWACLRSTGGSATTTSGGTAAATRWDWPERTSRSARASSWSPTRSMR
jgi:hypothetical protein